MPSDGYFLMQKAGMLQKSLFILAILVLSTSIASCAGTTMGVNAILQNQFDIDPVFREFYDMLGGEDVLRPAISPLFEVNDARYQFTAAGLMVHDPQNPKGQAYYLAGLGLDMGILEPAVSAPDGSQARYMDGHVIGEYFVPFYERLGGKRVVGKPVTEMHYNPEKGRYEQYFENLGMYWLENSPPGEVHLLASGVWKCNSSCLSYPPGNDTVEIPHRIDQVFDDAVARWGIDFTGRAITEPRQTPDGYTEQVFENVVLLVEAGGAGRAFLRPITKDSGYPPDPPSDETEVEGQKFIAVQGGKGYNVPQQFLDYIARHGSLEVSGMPVSEFEQVRERLSRQCFTNLCLEMYPGLDGSQRVRPAPLGYAYKMLPIQALDQPREELIKTPQEVAQVSSDNPTQPQATEMSWPTSAARELSMKVWESYSMVAPNQSQEIGVSILENNKPVRNLEPYLTVTYPDGREKTYYMFPTGEDGVSRVLLEAIEVPNGTLIPYQACIIDLNNEKYCVKHSFMIWQNP